MDPSDPQRLVVVQMSGGPGSGKSTLARSLAARLPALVLEMDLITQALLDRGAQGELIFASYDSVQALTGSMLDQKHSVVLDGPVYRDWVVEGSRRVAADRGAGWVMIECHCPDDAILNDRLAKRTSLPFQARSAEPVRRFTVAAPQKLVVDTRQPLEQCVTQALAHVEQALASLSPPA